MGVKKFSEGEVHMKIEVMARSGDELLADVTENTSPEELQWIDREFRDLLRRGYSAFGVQSGMRIDHFSSQIGEDLIIIAPLVGG